LILVDTNVLVDVVSDDPIWAGWSQKQLELGALEDELAINDIVYAELSVRHTTMEELDAMIRDARVVSVPIPRAALFLAGRAFYRYRAAGRVRTGVLPDFFLGAHAVISDCVLITRDAARRRTYFPGIMLIAPI
jgi:predicted nucleic acid-binding protein